MENTQREASFMAFEERDDSTFVRLRDKASLSQAQAPLPLFPADCNTHSCHDTRRLELIIIIINIIITIIIILIIIPDLAFSFIHQFLPSET